MYVNDGEAGDNIHVCRKELIPDNGKEAQRVTYIYIKK